MDRERLVENVVIQLWVSHIHCVLVNIISSMDTYRKDITIHTERAYLQHPKL